MTARAVSTGRSRSTGVMGAVGVVACLLLSFVDATPAAANAAAPQGVDVKCLVNPAACVFDKAKEKVTGAASDAASGVASAGIDAIAGSFRDATQWVIRNTLTWWIDKPTATVAEGDPAVESRPATVVGDLQAVTFYLAVVVAVGGVIVVGIRMCLTRRPDGLVDLVTGLFKMAFWIAAGAAAIQLVILATDGLAADILQRATGEGQPVSESAAGKIAGLGAMNGVPPAAIIVYGLVMMIVSVIQAVLMLFRQGAIVVLTGMVVLASAGSFNPATKPWLQKVLSWILSLVLYKLMAALVFFAAFAMIGDGQDGGQILVGITMFTLSIVALPAMMKFFSWAVPASSGGGGAAALPLAMSLRSAGASLGGGGRSVEQAGNTAQDLGPTGTGGGWRAGGRAANDSPPGRGGGAAEAPRSVPPASSTGAGAGAATMGVASAVQAGVTVADAGARTTAGAVTKGAP